MKPWAGAKVLTQRALRRLGLYERLRTSRLYDLYWSIADPAILQSRAQEVAFYRNMLEGMRAGDVIFDIGANVGYKTDIFLRLRANVVAVDPDAQNQESLRRRFLKLRATPCPVHVVGKAVSDGAGAATMYVDAPGSAKNTISAKWVDVLRQDEKRFGERLEFSSETRVETVTLDGLVAEHGLPLFVKIDVEGYETTVLRGLSQPVPYVSFEVNLPEFLEEGIECANLLSALDADGTFSVDPTLDATQARAWLRADALQRKLMEVTAQSVDVFWRSPLALACQQSKHSRLPRLSSR